MKTPTVFYCITLFAAILLFSSCESGGRIFSNAPSEKALVGKWKDEKNKYVTIEFFDDGKASFMGQEMKYSWLKDGKHLRFEYALGIATIYEAEIKDTTLIMSQNDQVTVYKKEK